MITLMAPMPSSSSYASSPTGRVEKATSEFLTGPDWTLNIDICDTINSHQMSAKDVVKAVKKRLQHKSPKVQLLALTLLETMVKNCGDYVHFQIAERKILNEMVKIIKKKMDIRVREKVLILIGSWYEAFGGSGRKYPQYYIAYQELRRLGVQFPCLPPDAVPIFTPPATHPTPRQTTPGYGMPSSSSTMLDEAMAAKDNLSLSSINSIRNVLDLLSDMLQAVDPNDLSAVKDEVINDLVEQCRVNQRKLVQLLGTTGDEELLSKGLELNDNLQTVLAKHDAIASGSPLPPVTNTTHNASKKHGSSIGPADVITHSPTSNGTLSAPVFPARRSLIDEDNDEEDDFALLARRHSKTQTDSSQNTYMEKSDSAASEAASGPAMSNALVPVDQPSPVRSKDQDIIDLLSITLSSSTEQTSQTFTSQMPTPGPISSTSQGATFSLPVNNGIAFNNYIAPWAQPQPPPQSLQPQPLYASQPQPNPPNLQFWPGAQIQPESHPQLQFPQYTSPQYPPPPWAATPGYFSNQNPASRSTYIYSTPRPISLSSTYPINGAAPVNTSPRSGLGNVGPKPFIPSYRLFEDLDVFSNADGRLKSTNNVSSSLLGSNSMIGGRK